MFSSTIVGLYYNIDLHPLTLDTNVSQEYKDDNVTVTVEWIHKAYHRLNITVTVVPSVPLIQTGNASRQLQLTIPYNTEYNLSLEGTAQCRPNVTVTAFIRLDYGEEGLTLSGSCNCEWNAKHVHVKPSLLKICYYIIIVQLLVNYDPYI